MQHSNRDEKSGVTRACELLNHTRRRVNGCPSGVSTLPLRSAQNTLFFEVIKERCRGLLWRCFGRV
jgi:hypothetical protein